MKDKKLTNDDTRDIAIRCLDSSINNRIIHEDLGDMEFKIQDIIHNEINKALNIEEDSVKEPTLFTCSDDFDCSGCDTDYYCFDHDITKVMDKYIKKGFTSKAGYLFFEDDKILDSFEHHLKGLMNLIKMTYREKK